MENKQPQQYFVTPTTVWFPDFQEELAARAHRWSRPAAPVGGLLLLADYFQGKLTRDAFLTQFFSQEAPQKALRADRELYRQVQELCRAFDGGSLPPEDLDAQLLLCLRNRPTEDVFRPAFEDWEDILSLLARITRKENTLPPAFDGIGWKAYLSGRLTRQEYTGANLARDTLDQLALLVSYGAQKEAFDAKYREELSLCLQLRTLFIEYREGKLSPEHFDKQFLHLATAFCVGI